MHRATQGFWELYQSLPSEARELADEKYKLLKQNPQHPSLRTRRIGDNYRRVRIGRRYRAIAVKGSQDFIWFWIGHRQDFDTLLRNLD